MTKYLIVFNTCEINIPNLDWYIQCIDNLLETECDDAKFNFDLAISGCMLTDNTKKVLKEKYKDKAFLNYIDCRLPVNITFNHTVNKIVDKVGRMPALKVGDIVFAELEAGGIDKLYDLQFVKMKRIKDIFTRVLKGHIAVANYKIKKNTCGAQIDIAARKPLKEINLNYNDFYDELHLNPDGSIKVFSYLSKKLEKIIN